MPPWFRDEALVGNTVGGNVLLGLPVQQMEMSRIDIDVVDKMMMKEHTIVIRVSLGNPMNSSS